MFKRVKSALRSYILHTVREEEMAFTNKLKKLGDNVFLQAPITVHTPECVTLGNRCSIAAYVHIWGQGGVDVGDGTMIASHTAITSAGHDPESVLMSETFVTSPVKIGENVWIGAHSIILPGVVIGDGAIVGAGSVVRKSVAENSIVAGVPAREIKKRIIT